MDDLPIILISATNSTVATEIISEIIDNDVSCEYTRDAQGEDRVWRLVNKYYRADVRLHALPDDAQLTVDPLAVEAHVIYIAQNELADGAAWAQRRAHSAVWPRADVERAVLAQCAAPEQAGALGAWAWAARALLVARDEPPVPPQLPREPFAEACGTQRLRDQLHAHTWRNLSRVTPEPQLPLGVCGEWREAESAQAAVEHGAALADVLGAALAARGQGARAERLARAELVLRALCRLPR